MSAASPKFRLHKLHDTTTRQDTNIYPHTYSSLIFFTEMPEMHTSSTSGVGKTTQLHVEE